MEKVKSYYFNIGDLVVGRSDYWDNSRYKFEYSEKLYIVEEAPYIRDTPACIRRDIHTRAILGWSIASSAYFEKFVEFELVTNTLP